MPPFPHPRYERMLVTETLGLAEVLALVCRHPALFREAFPPRVVNHIYLDSPDLQDYQDHISGVSSRTKTRIRWYGAWSGDGLAATLEQKLKHGLVSGKASQPLPPISVNGRVSDSAIRAVLQAADLPPRRRLALAPLQPALLNRYHRHYFVSADRRFRLTVDSALRFAAARPAGVSPTAFHGPTSTIVIELKYACAEADAASAVTNALPLRIARCSKYVLGIDQVRG